VSNEYTALTHSYSARLKANQKNQQNRQNENHNCGSPGELSFREFSVQFAYFATGALEGSLGVVHLGGEVREEVVVFLELVVDEAGLLTDLLQGAV